MQINNGCINDAVIRWLNETENNINQHDSQIRRPTTY